jgi:hypothetical protein
MTMLKLGEEFAAPVAALTRAQNACARLVDQQILTTRVGILR